MTFVEVYTSLEQLGVEVEWCTPNVHTSFTARIDCDIVTATETTNVNGDIVYTLTSSTSQYPVEYVDTDSLYVEMSVSWVKSSGTKFTNIDPTKEGAQLVPFADIKIGSYFYHGGLSLKISDTSYFNTRVVNLKLDTPVALCIADVRHKPFVIA